VSNATDRRPEVHGVVVIDKPPGWTSHDVVAKSRGILGTRKVGHAGTLDPDATGVLVLGVGGATRLLRFLTGLRKQYVGEIVLGVSTTTLDAAGAVTAQVDMSAVGPEQVTAAAARFVGAIEQIPPMVSAIKIDGRRLHELAREGKEVERAPRPVTVHRFEVTPIQPLGPHPVYRAVVECSSGTYVRTLAADLGAALGGGGHLRALRRTAVGSFTLADACTLETLTPEAVLAPAQAVRDFAAVTVDAAVAALVANGRVLDRDELGAEGDGPWAVLDPAGGLLAVYEPHAPGRLKPAVVLAQGGGKSAGRYVPKRVPDASTTEDG
jgi:tRNA pseudouridine55 synthase